MYGFLIFAAIIAIAIIVSRKNINSRQNELYENLVEAEKMLKKAYSKLSAEDELKLKESLNKKEIMFLDFFLNEDRSNVKYNMWSTQQSIILIQDIMIKINNLG